MIATTTTVDGSKWTAATPANRYIRRGLQEVHKYFKHTSRLRMTASRDAINALSNSAEVDHNGWQVTFYGIDVVTDDDAANIKFTSENEADVTVTVTGI